jgi:hypothetical protein
MHLRLALFLLSLAWPAFAQPVSAPDCTADVEVARDLVLDVRYRCRASVPLGFMTDDGRVAAHVSGLGASRVEPVNGLVEARYRYDLGAYARGVDNTRAAVERGGGVLAILGSWLLEPRGYERAATIDLRVQTPPGLSFAAGLPKVGDAWRLEGLSARFAGYTAIGQVALSELAVPLPGALRTGAARRDGVLRLALLDGFAGGSRPELVDWVRLTTQAMSNYWQGFTAPQMLVGLVPSSRRGVGYGRAVSGGGPSVMIEVGREVDKRRLFDDWVLVHELIHTGMPFIRGRAMWFMEGAATYIEPIIRARAGWKSEEDVWLEWVENMPLALPAFTAGLANASGRENYWGGALFMLMADVGLRRATQGTKGLEDCLSEALWAGFHGARRATLEEYAQACDRGTGTTAMSALLDRHFTRASSVDLVEFWRELGVSRIGGRILLDDAAPLARWRKLIVMGPADRPPRRVKLPWQS